MAIDYFDTNRNFIISTNYFPFYNDYFNFEFYNYITQKFWNHLSNYSSIESFVNFVIA